MGPPKRQHRDSSSTGMVIPHGDGSGRWGWQEGSRAQHTAFSAAPCSRLPREHDKCCEQKSQKVNRTASPLPKLGLRQSKHLVGNLQMIYRFVNCSKKKKIKYKSSLNFQRKSHGKPEHYIFSLHKNVKTETCLCCSSTFCERCCDSSFPSSSR